uniref:Uncharacterized protein n=1 Tax=Ananas comosus var. bracteatus TaxID=296719 RepID=A0A6V7Q261_ANACO|nr:unnamed protein product [Ananas comosus var. bracteatus]
MEGKCKLGLHCVTFRVSTFSGYKFRWKTQGRDRSTCTHGGLYAVDAPASEASEKIRRQPRNTDTAAHFPAGCRPRRRGRSTGGRRHRSASAAALPAAPPDPRFPSLNNTSHHRNALKTRTRRNPPITNALPPRQQRRKKKMRQAEEEEKEKEKEKENEAPLPPLPPPSLPMWNLRSRRRAASGDQKTGLPFRPLPDRDNPLPIRQKSPTFSFALSKAEIKNDFMHITGKRPGWRPKKRWPRSIQQQLASLFPGEFLWNIPRNSRRDLWDDIF